MLGYRRWALFFVVYGMNAIVAYMAPDLINFDRISNANLAGLAAAGNIRRVPDHWRGRGSSLAWALLHVPQENVPAHLGASQTSGS